MRVTFTSESVVQVDRLCGVAFYMNITGILTARIKCSFRSKIYNRYSNLYTGTDMYFLKAANASLRVANDLYIAKKLE